MSKESKELNKLLNKAIGGDRSAQLQIEAQELDERINAILNDTSDPYKYGYPEIEAEGEYDEELRIDNAQRAHDMNETGRQRDY